MLLPKYFSPGPSLSYQSQPLAFSIPITANSAGTEILHLRSILSDTFILYMKPNTDPISAIDPIC